MSVTPGELARIEGGDGAVSAMYLQSSGGVELHDAPTRAPVP